MSKVILGKVARKTKPNRTVKSPTDTANPGTITTAAEIYSADGGTSHLWPRPDGIQAGDHIYTAINLFRSNGEGLADVASKPAGALLAAEFTSTGTGVADVRYLIYYEVADGTETDTTFTTDVGARVSLVSWRLASNGVTLGTPEVAGPDDSAPPDPDPITPSAAGEYAVFPVVHATKGGPGTAPTNYTTVEEALDGQDWSQALRPRTYVAQRQVDISTNEDPGAITWPDTAGNRIYRVWTVATRLDTGTPALATGDHTHVEADVTDLDHWTEADHDALDHTGLTGVGGGGSVDDLTDATITGTPADNELFAYDSGTSEWINQTAAEAGLATATHAATHADGGADEIDGSDLASGAATDGWVLTADGAGGAAWEAVPAGGSVALDDLTDVTITTPSTGEVLTYNGSGWVNDTAAGGGGQAVPYRVQYLAERVTGETSHTDDLFFATEGSLTGTAVDGPGTGTGTWSLSDGQLKLIVASTGGSGAREPKARAWAITSASAPMTIETHCTVNGAVPASHSPAVMLGFSDGTTTGATIVNTYSYLGLAGLLEAHGTFNGNGFSGFNDTILSSRFDVWQRVVWVSSNTFQVQVAITTPYTGPLLNWTAGGTGTLAKTMTPTHYWVGAANDSSTDTWIAWDYVRVYDSDLSV